MLPRTFFFCGGFGLRKKGKGKKGNGKGERKKGGQNKFYYCYVKRKERR